MLKSQQLLQNEEEFLRLNSEIDLATKDLMEQASQVMNHQTLVQDPPTWDLTKGRNMKSPEMSETDIEVAYNKLFKSGDIGDLPQIQNGSLPDSSDTKTDNTNDNNGNMENGTSGSESNDDNKIIRGRNWKLCHSANVSTMNVGQGFDFPGKLTRHKSEIKLKDRELDNVLPESMKGMGQENIIRFLKAKIKVLTEQLDVLHGDEKKHVDKIKELQADRERVAEDRDKWIQQANIAKNVLVKHEQHASNIVVQMQNIQAENGHLKREVEKLKKELKQTTQNSGSNEVRLNRSIEEVEKLKASLRQAKQDEKDLKESYRKKTEELSGAVKRLDKQRIELLHAFKKQLVIIDNLKKQKGLVEAGKFVKSVEDDFMEFLDWNPGNT